MKAVKIILRVIAGIAWVLGLVIFAGMAMDFSDDPYMASFGYIMLGCYLVFTVGGYFGVRDMKKKRARRKAERAERERKIAAGVIPAHVHTARHTAGLPAPAGVPCEVRVFAQKVEFFAGGQVYQVPTERVTGAQEYTDTEMRQYVRSSAFQTILGAAAFGGVGAVVGAMPESRYKREVSKHNLAITFVSETGEASAVVLSADVSLLVLGQAVRKYARGVARGAVTL